MNIIITNSITDLKPYKVHEGEEIKFHIVRKGRADMWFSGKNNQIRNIYFGSLNLVSLGQMDSKTEKDIVQMMKDNKTDILTDGQDLYTRASKGFCRIGNFYGYYLQKNPGLHLFKKI